jgi:hypothetical protein
MSAESQHVSAGQTGNVLRELRRSRGLSLRQLAGLTYCDHSQLGNIEAGRRWPKDRGWIERTDIVLGGGGVLVAAWDADQQRIAQAANLTRLLDQAHRDSKALLTAPDGAALDDIQSGIVEISTNTRREPYETTLAQASQLRVELARRVRETVWQRPEQLRELYIALSRVCGVLSYITLDLGQSDTALVHARAAYTLADKANHDDLRVWARGTEALALRFAKDFQLARDVALDGLRFADGVTGTAKARLLCSLAASTSNLGDTVTAARLLNQADEARDGAGPDEVPGLFTFTETKQTYYHGFTLMWAEKPGALGQSVKASTDAISEWQSERAPGASLDSSTGDEMLTHIYLATANARLGELDASIAAVQPVLDLPITAHFSWVRKRLHQLDGLLAKHFPDSQVAADARTTLQAYEHA